MAALQSRTDRKGQEALRAKGWLFDAYDLAGRMVFWIITESGRTVRLEDHWMPSFYVASDDEANLKAITREFAPLVNRFEFVSRRETLMDHSMSQVLKVTLADSKKRASLAEKIWMLGEFGKYRLYNVDLLPAQAYFYEHDLFPLAYCKVTASKSGLKWKINMSNIFNGQIRSMRC